MGAPVVAQQPSRMPITMHASVAHASAKYLYNHQGGLHVSSLAVAPVNPLEMSRSKGHPQTSETPHCKGPPEGPLAWPNAFRQESLYTTDSFVTAFIPSGPGKPISNFKRQKLERTCRARQ